MFVFKKGHIFLIMSDSYFTYGFFNYIGHLNANDKLLILFFPLPKLPCGVRYLQGFSLNTKFFERFVSKVKPPCNHKPLAGAINLRYIGDITQFKIYS